VEKQYREAEAKKIVQKEAVALLARLKKGEPLETIAREKALKVTETGLFQPGGAVPKLGASTELTEALFQISEKKPYPEQAYLIGENFVIVRLRERGKPNDAEFASQKDSITKYLRQQKRGEIVKAWIEGNKSALIKEGRLKMTRDFKEL
jgi:peptidyl-prolyl cis-trans isomerase D